MMGISSSNETDANGDCNMAQTAKTQQSRLMPSPKALQKAL
jgi:hypothetical protein